MQAFITAFPETLKIVLPLVFPVLYWNCFVGNHWPSNRRTTALAEAKIVAFGLTHDILELEGG